MSTSTEHFARVKFLQLACTVTSGELLSSRQRNIYKSGRRSLCDIRSLFFDWCSERGETESAAMSRRGVSASLSVQMESLKKSMHSRDARRNQGRLERAVGHLIQGCRIAGLLFGCFIEDVALDLIVKFCACME